MASSAEGSHEEKIERESSETTWSDAELGNDHVLGENTEGEHVTADAGEMAGEGENMRMSMKYTVDNDMLMNQKSDNLQDAFMRYKQKRQRELKKVTRKRREVPDEVRLRAMANPDRMWKLRMKFLEQTKKYFGVPYARKYWKPEEPEYNSKLFLDCCALVRRAMRDLKKDFGFKIGPWNQCYMCDTLPITIEKEEDMKPGDLVFISAVFYSAKMKKQKHCLTHVEVWLGEGQKSIGARWHKGKVQVFDSYQFKSTSYHSMRYIFKSIDTWLMGICRSHCPEHPWKTRMEQFKPEKKSIFSLPALDKTDDDYDESAGDSSDEQQTAAVQPITLQKRETTAPPTDKTQRQPISDSKSKLVVTEKKKTPRQSPPKRGSKSAQPRLRSDNTGQSGSVKVESSRSADSVRPATQSGLAQKPLRGLGVQGRSFGQRGSKHDKSNRDQLNQPTSSTSNTESEIFPEPLETPESEPAISNSVLEQEPELHISELSIFDKTTADLPIISIDEEFPNSAYDMAGVSTPPDQSSSAKMSNKTEPLRKGLIVTQLDSASSLKSTTSDVPRTISAQSCCQGNGDDFTSVAATEYLENIVTDDSMVTEQVASSDDKAEDHCT